LPAKRTVDAAASAREVIGSSIAIAGPMPGNTPMLAQAKVERLRQQADAPLLDLAGIVCAVALDRSPLMTDKDLASDIETATVPLRADKRMLREPARKPPHDAIRHAPKRPAPGPDGLP
jgi:hypothetical protein